VSGALEGKTCVVTGAGRGIGRLLALELAAHGADLVLCARTREELEATAREMRASYAVDALVRVADVTDTQAIGELATEVASRRPAYGLVNCAAVLGPVGRIDQVQPSSWREAIMVNLVGTATCCAAFAPQMIGAGKGSIVNLSGGGVGGPHVPERISAYTASKAGVASLTETLGHELAPNVRVNAVAPGPVPTGFMRDVLDGGPDVAGERLYEATVRQHARPPSPDRFLELMIFLLSDRSAPITGKLLSAQWDPLESLAVGAMEITDSSRFTMRRIDEVLYGERARPPTAS
jgi:NAD(P)-dependent dehydrogenase (short-subunit alcohol dehydrogenase family)